jgi:hypothetical protein
MDKRSFVAAFFMLNYSAPVILARVIDIHD